MRVQRGRGPAKLMTAAAVLMSVIAVVVAGSDN
jgi:hypothetical protein